jgi:hypothetical protein
MNLAMGQLGLYGIDNSAANTHNRSVRREGGGKRLSHDWVKYQSHC